MKLLYFQNYIFYQHKHLYSFEHKFHQTCELEKISRRVTAVSPPTSSKWTRTYCEDPDFKRVALGLNRLETGHKAL